MMAIDGAIVAAVLFAVGVVYQTGRLTARVDAIERAESANTERYTKLLIEIATLRGQSGREEA